MRPPYAWHEPGECLLAFGVASGPLCEQSDGWLGRNIVCSLLTRQFELVGECSCAMESDTVPGVCSAPYGEIESGRGDHPRLEHAVKAFMRSAQWVRFGRFEARA